MYVAPLDNDNASWTPNPFEGHPSSATTYNTVHSTITIQHDPVSFLSRARQPGSACLSPPVTFVL